MQLNSNCNDYEPKFFNVKLIRKVKKKDFVSQHSINIKKNILFGEFDFKTKVN